MKYITQDWTSTKDGYLFFVQRLQEMLFHYSDDIVKAPVHNTQTLLEEYVDTEKDVVKGSIKQYQLDIIAKEIKSSLMTDVIVRELYKYEVIEEMAKFLDKDQRTAVHYIFNKIPKKKYYEICCKYLKENLSESNRKTEIEKGLRAWLELMVKLAKDKCLGTIQDVFTDTYLLLNKKKKNLKEPGNVDEQSIMLLLENFFIEE